MKEIKLYNTVVGQCTPHCAAELVQLRYSNQMKIFLCPKHSLTQSAGAAEYIDCIAAVG